MFYRSEYLINVTQETKSLLILKKKKKIIERYKLRRFPYRNTEVMKHFVGGKLVRVVVLVRWKQFTQALSVNVRKCSQVIGNA